MQGGKAVCSKLFNNSNPLRKKSEGFAGKVRRDKKSVVFVENGSAMRAAGCLDGNLRQAVRALLGGLCNETDKRRNNVIGQGRDNVWRILSIICVYVCKSEKTDARIGHPLEVIRTTRNRQK